MNKFKNVSAFLLLLTTVFFMACSIEPYEGTIPTPAPTPTPSSQYAMTAKIDGVLWQMNNPFNSNYATRAIFSYHPDTDFIQLQGRKGGTLGLDEIVLLIKRTDLAIGTYPISLESYDGSKTQIDINYNSHPTIQYVVEGTLSVTAIDIINKKVSGTFSFNCADQPMPIDATNPITTVVTEGKFNYKYDFPY